MITIHTADGETVIIIRDIHIIIRDTDTDRITEDIGIPVTDLITITVGDTAVIGTVIIMVIGTVTMTVIMTIIGVTAVIIITDIMIPIIQIVITIIIIHTEIATEQIPVKEQAVQGMMQSGILPEVRQQM